MNVTQHKLAVADPCTASADLRKSCRTRRISADAALRLARYFGTPSAYIEARSNSSGCRLEPSRGLPTAQQHGSIVEQTFAARWRGLLVEPVSPTTFDSRSHDTFAASASATATSVTCSSCISTACDCY